MKPETKVYHVLKEYYTKKKYLYKRIEFDTIPDIFISKKDKWYMVEVKVCKKKKLTNLMADLTWQPGQIAFSVLLNRFSPNHYRLIVKHGESLKEFKNVYNVNNFKKLDIDLL